ncbi:hypothetical protein Tc00.1047053511407.30 [Trypanosoma cruzi]|uniref:Uncharacterized protein n=1 Tax=Trypanosoma cruzi (strain CL Brener) TaxID=353153 RepID=Q4D7W0_TRYCC|nr:hypothetical protein Tc00.1047053511407.30 [Trypanosoma cruzi]EAN88609.1 hypothetical protein Tc00.1047053511407.30 [Trypanosoma cruzi]|eukprot:XP_810460.1 hypothetical protein [Trypanosoma cruzi strain CL Brener]
MLAKACAWGVKLSCGPLMSASSHFGCSFSIVLCICVCVRVCVFLWVGVRVFLFLSAAVYSAMPYRFLLVAVWWLQFGAFFLKSKEGVHKVKGRGKRQGRHMASVTGGREKSRSSTAPSSFAALRTSNRQRRDVSEKRRVKGSRTVSGERRAVKMENLQAQLTYHKTRLVEKLLDLYVRDALSNSFEELRRKERERTFHRALTASFSEWSASGEGGRKYTVGRSHATNGGPTANVSEMERMIRERLRDEYRVDAAHAAEHWFTSPQEDGFVFVVLRRLVSMTREEAQQEIRKAVAQYVDPHVKAFWDLKRLHRVTAGYSLYGSELRSVQEAIHRAIAKKRAELERNRATKTELQRADRVHRVKTAFSMLKRDVGDVSSLRYVVPERYEAPPDVQLKEQLRKLRVRVHQQQLEEQALQQRLESSREAAKKRLKLLRDEVEAIRQKIYQVEHEIASKTIDIEELQAASAKGLDDGRDADDNDDDKKKENMETTTTTTKWRKKKRGRSLSWAEQTLQLEFELAEATRDEPELQTRCEELRRRLQALTAEKNMLDAEIATNEAELTTSLSEKEEIARMLTAGVEKARATVLHLRRQQNLLVGELNSMRDVVLHGRSHGLLARRALKSRLLETASQLALEKLLHARLTAQVQWQREQIHREQQAISTLSNVPQRSAKERQMESFDRVVTLAKELARWTIDEGDKETTSLRNEDLESRIQDRVVVCHDACLRLRGEIAKMISSEELARRVAQRQQELLEHQWIEWKVRQEDLLVAAVEPFRSATVNASPLPVPLPTAEVLHHETQRLYAALSHMLHRESRCKAILQLLQGYEDRASSGNEIQLLPFRPAGNFTADSIRLSSLPSVATTTTTTNTAPTGTVQPQSIIQMQISPAAAHRKMVLQFIKNEIQPLYDSNQISRVRFMDVVERVSRWFLTTHPLPQPVLAENEQQAICQQIQATLTWQDEQQIKRRGA